MRSWRGWELELCLSLHFDLARQRYCCCWLQHERGPYFQPVCRSPHQSDQNTRITAPFRRTKGCVNGVATDRMCERKLHYCSFVCLFVALHFFPSTPPSCSQCKQYNTVYWCCVFTNRVVACSLSDRGRRSLK